MAGCLTSVRRWRDAGNRSAPRDDRPSALGVHTPQNVIYNYILKFAAGLETVPYTIQRMSALKDILRRMNAEG